MTLGSKLIELRIKLDLSQAEVAARAKIDTSYVYRLEKDQVSHVAADILSRLANALQVPITVLLEAAGLYEPHSLAAVESELQEIVRRAEYEMSADEIALLRWLIEAAVIKSRQQRNRHTTTTDLVHS